MARSHRRPQERTEEREIRAESEVRLAVVADTHSNPHPDALAHLAALSPTAILHAGDIGDLAVIERLERVAPTIAVRGNIDERELPDHIVLTVKRDTAALRIFLTHIAVRGPKLMPSVAAPARAAGASVVICGHSHVPLIAGERGLSVFNPGSIGPRRFSLPITFGVLEWGQKLSARHVDCETGETWLPG